MARYPLGQEKGKARVVADGSVEAESGSSTGGLIEFLPELPKLPAQIDVELSHHALLNDSRESWAGFYVARTNLPTARGDGHALLYARFSDRGKSASPAPLAEIQIPDRKLHLTYSGILLPHDTAEVTKMNLRFIKPPLSKPVPTFVERGATRHIRFVLDDRGVTLSQVLDGNVAQVVGNVEWSTLREGQQRDIRTCGDDAVRVGTGQPTGGLGVYAYHAKVRVSGVTVTALSGDVLQR